MGYESRIYIGERSSIKDDDGTTHVRIIAMFNMCVMGSLINVFEKNTDCYFYDDDGNTKVLEDMNGDKLREAPIEDFIYVLEEALDSGEKYRRIFPLLSTLQTIYKQQKDGIWKNIVILHYGY